MNSTCIEWSLSGIHLVNFQGGRQAEFKSSKPADDKLILLSVSLPLATKINAEMGVGRNVVREESLEAVRGRNVETRPRRGMSGNK